MSEHLVIFAFVAVMLLVFFSVLGIEIHDIIAKINVALQKG